MLRKHMVTVSAFCPLLLVHACVTHFTLNFNTYYTFVRTRGAECDRGFSRAKTSCGALYHRIRTLERPIGFLTARKQNSSPYCSQVVTKVRPVRATTWPVPLCEQIKEYPGTLRLSAIRAVLFPHNMSKILME